MCCCRVTTISNDWLINKQYSRDIQAYLLHTTTKIRHRASTSTRWHYAFALCYHNNETRPPIANPPKNAQLGGIPYHSPSYIRVRAVVWACGDGQTDRLTQTHRETHRRAWPIYISPRLHLTRNVIGTVSLPASSRYIALNFTALRRNWFSQLHFHCSRQSTTDMIYLFPNFMKIYPFLFNPAEKQTAVKTAPHQKWRRQLH